MITIAQLFDLSSRFLVSFVVLLICVGDLVFLMLADCGSICRTQTDRQTDRQTDGRMDRQTDRETRQTDRPDRQTDSLFLEINLMNRGLCNSVKKVCVQSCVARPFLPHWNYLGGRVWLRKVHSLESQTFHGESARDLDTGMMHKQNIY